MTPVASVQLTGLQPQPLAAYLAALGVLRICGTQRDPAIRGAFTPSGFRLEGIAEDELIAFLTGGWQPSPVLSPWNNASGFYRSSKGQPAAVAISTLLASPDARFEKLRRTIKDVRRILDEYAYEDAPADEQKAQLLQALRTSLSDEAIAWVDAAAVIEGADVRMMPVLGSGGNEGVLDYSSLFLRSLVDTLLGERRRCDRLLRASLLGSATLDLLERPGGQFDPGTAGGFNTGPGFESKDLPNNPWTFMLLVEGALLWTSAIASRQQGAESGYRFAISPFTVRHRAAGYGSAGFNDDDPQRVRAEVWMPVWRRPTTYAELARFIEEGRVETRSSRGKTRRAVDSMDFADAVGGLGVDRGVESFVRYAFVKRRGESYIALPMGQLDVRYRAESDLLRQLDRPLDQLDGFLRRFPSEQGPPAQLEGCRRAIDEARFDVAARGGSEAMVRLVRAIGAMEMQLARRDPGKAPKLAGPLGGLGPEWITACGDDVEVRLAAALASVAAAGGIGPIRSYLAPISTSDPKRYAPAPRALSWSGRDLADRLSSVLQRRLLDARAKAGSGVRSGSPTIGARPVRLADLATFLAPKMVDDRAIEELLFGFTWVKPGAGAPAPKDQLAPPLPRSFALLKLLFLPQGLPDPNGRTPLQLQPSPSIVPLLRAGRVTEAVDRAFRQLAAKGLRPRQTMGRGSDGAVGSRLAAALLIPTDAVEELCARALIRDDRGQKDEARR